MKHPRTVMTFSDSGAHVSQMSDCSIQTHLLAYWVRERQDFTLEEAVRMLTLAPARGVGLPRPGSAARRARRRRQRVRPRHRRTRDADASFTISPPVSAASSRRRRASRRHWWAAKSPSSTEKRPAREQVASSGVRSPSYQRADRPTDCLGAVGAAPRPADAPRRSRSDADPSRRSREPCDGRSVRQGVTRPPRAPGRSPIPPPDRPAPTRRRPALRAALPSGILP